ncbi:MAG: 16S rRNA (cytosine(967)-C(5))-methyltransferase RsmB [Ruminiclostridium sp.]|nr:16S rRNA (cytosine(967)-C(5))-methyltransferase RsmB [Ruminiclostridium sp.]
MDKVRETALKALMKIETKEAYSNLVLKKLLKNNALDTRDRAFITELVYGTVTRQITLDWVISKYSKTKLAKLSKWVLLILRMGIYQIVFLGKVPHSAACNTSVDLAKKYAKASSGFVNAILRNISRNGIDLNKIDTDSKAGNMSVRYSFPKHLIEQWLSQYGEYGEYGHYGENGEYGEKGDYGENGECGEEFTEKLLASLLEKPEFSVRVNTLKTTQEKAIESFGSEGIEAKPGRFLEEALIINNSSDISMAQPFIKGEITVQDESSMMVARILDPKAGERVLDVCAAPGGKTTHIAQLMKNEGHITAWDIYEHKVRLISENSARLGITIINALENDATQLVDSEINQYDRVLADVPCSGTGIIRRKPDIKWQRDVDNVGNLIEIQKKILYNASRYVKPGGVLVYSTCSLDDRENAQVVRAFLKTEREFEPEPLLAYLPEPLKNKNGVNNGMLRLYPHIDGTDGFFIARLKKKAK